MDDSQDRQKENADAKAEVVLRIVRSVIKQYSMQKTIYECSVCCLQMKLRPRFIEPFTLLAKKAPAYTLDLPLIEHRSRVLRWQDQAVPGSESRGRGGACAKEGSCAAD